MATAGAEPPSGPSAVPRRRRTPRELVVIAAGLLAIGFAALVVGLVLLGRSAHDASLGVDFVGGLFVISALTVLRIAIQVGAENKLRRDEAAPTTGSDRSRPI